MRIGLLMSGGFGKGAYQAGALKALNRYVPPERIDCVSAASIGCLNSYLYVTERYSYAEELWRSLNTISDNVFISDIFKSTYLKNAIKEIATPEYKKTFYLPVCQLGLRNRVASYVNLGEVSDFERRRLYMQAGIAVPMMCRSVEIDGNRYFDGGVFDNTPSRPLLDYNLDCIIALYFDKSVKSFDDSRFKGKVIKICFDDGVRMKNDMCLTQKSISAMINQGEEQTENVLSFVFGQGIDDTEAVHSLIKTYDKMNSDGKNKRSFTVTRAISVLNNLTKPFIKKD